MGEAAPTAVIGVDVGGTKTLALLVELPADGGPPTVMDRETVPSDAGSERAVDSIIDSITALTDRHEAPPAAIGIGLAGFVDRGGIVRTAPNAGGLVGLDVGDLVGTHFGIPAYVDNDANCVAVAAHRRMTHGDNPSAAEDLVAVTLGTGIGGGIVLGGQLLRGANGFAGEPGHMVIERDGPLCPCGQRGCWERFASGSGLARLARLAVERGDAPGVLEAAGSVEAVRGEHVTDLLDDNDPGALAVFTEYASYVALGLANLIVLFDPEVVVIGGGISSEGALLRELLMTFLEEGYPAAMRAREVHIVITPEGPEAGAIGAAILGGYRRRQF